MTWVLKTSTVRVSTREVDQAFPSLEEVPGPLREKVKAAIEGPDAEVLLIASQEVYEHITSRRKPAAEEGPKKRAVEAVVPARHRPMRPENKRAISVPALMALFSGAMLLVVLFWIWIGQSAL